MELHCHSTASDGIYPPAEVVARAHAAGVRILALTDHDTLEGLPAALEAGARLGVRVIAGCEFSVQVPWGEMHLLGYFLPVGHAPLERFLATTRDDRARRGADMAARLQGLGLSVDLADIEGEADGGAIGRPHVARALLKRGQVATVQEAFDRYIGWGRPGFVEKKLPAFRDVAELVHGCGGVVSAAHLKDRGTRSNLTLLKGQGLDAVETRHPSHDPDARARLTDLAQALGLLRSGGSDWHGEESAWDPGTQLGGQEVPEEWVTALEAARREPRPAAAS